METKTATVKSVKFIEERSEGDSIIRKWGIKMDNGDIGYYETSEKDQKDFVEGQEATYLWEPPEKEKDEKGKVVPGTIKVAQEQEASSKPSPYKPNSSLREHMTTRVKEKMLMAVSEIPSQAASHAAYICASKGDFQKDEIIKGEDGLYNKLYDIIAGKMFDDMHRVSEEVKKILEEMDE